MACDGQWKLSRPVSWAQSARCMSGAIGRYGRRLWIGRRVRILFLLVSIGTFGSDRHKSVLTRRRGRKEAAGMVADASAVAKVGCIIRSSGVVGRILGPAHSAIWLALRQTCASGRRDLANRAKVTPK